MPSEKYRKGRLLFFKRERSNDDVTCFGFLPFLAEAQKAAVRLERTMKSQNAQRPG